jgi:putative spermidine/putrescine transport system ATP-binding protein
MTNVIAAQIDGDTCRLPWGAVCRIENPAETDIEGVAIRPEDLAIVPVEGEHDGVIEQSMFMGAATHYWIKAAGQTLRAITSGGSNAILPAGQKVRLVPPAALHLLKSLGGTP